MPAIRISQNRSDLIRIVLNPTFWREHERLIEAAVFAVYLDARKELRPFVIARAQGLRTNQRLASRPLAQTPWEQLALSSANFARLRERPDFQARVHALRRQALVWSLARAALRELAETSDAPTADIDRPAAEMTFALHGSPAPRAFNSDLHTLKVCSEPLQRW